MQLRKHVISFPVLFIPDRFHDATSNVVADGLRSHHVTLELGVPIQARPQAVESFDQMSGHHTHSVSNRNGTAERRDSKKRGLSARSRARVRALLPTDR